MRKLWDIHGGIHPPENKAQSLQRPLSTLPLFEHYVLPLNQHVGAPAIPIVTVGQKVLKGEPVAEAQGVFSASLHAPTSGKIVAIDAHVIAHPSGLPHTCITIEADGEDQWTTLNPCEDPDQLDHFALVERVRQAGLAGMGGAGFPTAVKLNPRSTDRIQTLIINGTECEPYITADDMLMREAAAEIVAGALLLARTVGNPAQILIGIEDNKPEAIAAMQQAAGGTPVEVVVFPTKYPSGGEKQLVQILTGQEIPSGQLPAHIGVLVQNVGTAYATWRAVRHGEPLIERITTVVGDALARPGNVRARIGTPIAKLLDFCGFTPEAVARLIIGGPMMGFAIDDPAAPVVKTTNCVLVPSHTEMPEAPPAQPCIRCGMCAEVCPARLLPQQLFWYAQAQDFEKLESHNLFDCIECGACSYTCPSTIPLVQYYRAAKGSIRRQEAEKEKADRARQRFEQRQQRIEKAEHEKEQKRLARKIAAEEARKKLAETGGDTTRPAETAIPAAATPLSTGTSAPISVVASAPGTDDRGKLERAHASAQLRVEHLQKQLADCDDSAGRDKLNAALKQAELKLQTAQQKLAAPPDAPRSIADKMNLSPVEARQKAVDTLRKRLTAAETRLEEAQQQGSDNLAAIAQGVDKLREKLADANTALLDAQASPTVADPREKAARTAADEAIIRAQTNAARQASFSPVEKQQHLVDSLGNRLQKAQAKLQQAVADNSDHIEVLRGTVEKLETKLKEAQDGLARLKT